MGEIGPRAIYAKALEANEIQSDPAQQLAVELLQARTDQLLQTRPGLFRRIFSWGETRQPPRGIYFWGGVGRGKTYLMDLFFDSLPFNDKLRLHFHRFMYLVHQELRRLQGEKDPLQEVAAILARDARVLCFDEFHVSDIADAMILYGLLDTLLEKGVMLIATSNLPPERLYEDGLQRSKFLPAIDLIQQHTQVVNLDAGVDYRLRALTRADLYYCPLDARADAALMASFCRVCPEFARRRETTLPGKDCVVEIHGRTIMSRYAGEGVVWFDFSVICEGPRSQDDYIVIARLYHTVVVSGVPQMDSYRDNAARRFISLIDEFYDRNIKLLVSAEVDIDDLYKGVRLAFEFTRTRSRLQEMQSAEYLARPHLP